jgi:integrase
MRNYCASNERIKREYFTYLKEARQQSVESVDAVAKALNRFEVDSKFRDFKTFHTDWAVAFKRHLAEQRSQSTGEALSKATMYSTLAHLKRFFQWLAREPGYRGKVQYSDADYFNLSEKETRIAKARREPKVPTLEQIKHVLVVMPAESIIDHRNRALVAFTILTGARDSAIASMKLKHIDLANNLINQDARDVKTKFSKTFTTTFFPVGEEIRDIVIQWVNYLRQDQLWGNDDPLFPATAMRLNQDQQFQVDGIDRKHWSSAGPIRRIFQEAFKAAGLPYFNPHTFRNTLVKLGQERCQTPEQFKAWSQNLGHEGVLTTFTSYGAVSPDRQAALIASLKGRQPAAPIDPSDFANELMKIMKDRAAVFPDASQSQQPSGGV